MPIALMATAAWLTGLLYYTKFHWLKEPTNEKWGVKFVFRFLLSFVIAIAILYFISRLSSAKPPAPPSAPNTNEAGMMWLQWMMVSFFAINLLLAFMGFLSPVVKHLTGGKSTVRWFVYCFLALALSVAMTVKVFWNPPLVGNLMLITLAGVFATEFIIRLTKGGFIGIFVAIMILDVIMVWLTSGIGPGKGSVAVAFAAVPQDNWYISIFRSEFMKHFPYPIGLMWNGHMLGNGDVFFLCLTVMYAKRVWSTTAAIVAGLAATLPVVLLPFAFYVMESPPPAWPYTIFIVPVALFVAIFAPKPIRVPEEWKDVDGPEVIGNPPKEQ